MLNIIKTELKNYLQKFKTYIFIGVFLLFFSLFFHSEISKYGYINFNYTLATCVSILICALPLITINMFSKNKKQNKTNKSSTNINENVDKYESFRKTAITVLGKFIAATSIIIILEIIALIYVAILAYFGKVYISNILFGLSGFLLLAMCFISCGMFISSNFKNKYITLLITLASFAAIWLIPSINNIAIDYSLVYNFNTTFQNVIFSLKSLVLFITFIMFFIFITIIKLNNTSIKIIKNKISNIKKQDESDSTKNANNIKINKYIIIILSTLILILINFGINKLNIKSIDVTSQNLYTLSDKSKQLISSVNSNVNVYFCGFADEEANVVMAKQYNEINSKINIEAIDITQRQDLAKKYGIEETDIGIVVECGKNYKVLSYQKLHEFDGLTNNYINIAEEKLTNAIISVTTEDKPNIYFITGHDEFDIFTYGELYSLNMYLQNDINNISTLNLSETYFPEGCDLLIIASPQSDYTEAEVEVIMNYINNGGNILWLNDSTFIDELPNLSKILDYYGISLSKGVVLEQNVSNVINESPYLIIPEVKEHEITREFHSKKSILFAQATKLGVKNEEELIKANITIKEIIKSSDTSLYFEDVNDVNAYETGPFVLGLESIKKIDENKSSKLIIFANNFFATDSQISIDDVKYSLLNIYNNKDLALNSVAYLNNRLDVEIEGKVTNDVVIEPSKNVNLIVVGIIFVIPVLVIVVGIIVWRRNILNSK